MKRFLIIFNSIIIVLTILFFVAIFTIPTYVGGTESEIFYREKHYFESAAKYIENCEDKHIYVTSNEVHNAKYIFPENYSELHRVVDGAMRYGNVETVYTYEDWIFFSFSYALSAAENGVVYCINGEPPSLDGTVKTQPSDEDKWYFYKKHNSMTDN